MVGEVGTLGKDGVGGRSYPLRANRLVARVVVEYVIGQRQFKRSLNRVLRVFGGQRPNSSRVPLREARQPKFAKTIRGVRQSKTSKHHLSATTNAAVQHIQVVANVGRVIQVLSFVDEQQYGAAKTTKARRNVFVSATGSELGALADGLKSSKPLLVK